MKRKGFTLIEVLAVLVLISIISLISFQVYDKSIKDTKKKTYDNQVLKIIGVAKDWSLMNAGSLSQTEDNIVTLDTLITGGYIKNDQIIDPRTDEEMDGCVVITWDTSYNQYKYNYFEVESGKCIN